MLGDPIQPPPPAAPKGDPDAPSRWPNKLIYAAIVFAAGFIWNANVRLARLEDGKATNDKQDAQIKWLVERTILDYNRLNETRRDANPPLLQYPYPERDRP